MSRTPLSDAAILRFKDASTLLDTRVEVMRLGTLCRRFEVLLNTALLDAARYRWLRNGNGYAPEENFARGGEDLDKLCDEGIAEATSDYKQRTKT